MKEVLLESDSPKKAQYKLKILALGEGAGFVVAKESGAAGSTRVPEYWYRETLQLAEKKFQSIYNQKTIRSRGRRYHEVPILNDAAQLDLFAEPAVQPKRREPNMCRNVQASCGLF